MAMSELPVANAWMLRRIESRVAQMQLLHGDDSRWDYAEMRAAVACDLGVCADCGGATCICPKGWSR